MLVVAPIIIGAVVTHLLTKTWQDYKHKINLKDDILKSFQESAWNIHNLQIAFMLKIVRKYLANNSLEAIEDIKFTTDMLEFPDKKSEDIPEIFFKNDLKTLQDKIDNGRYLSHIFVSKMQLYLDDGKMFVKYQKIRDDARILSDILLLIFKSKLVSEFARNIDDFNKKRACVRNDIVKFEKTLVDSKIRKIPV